MRVSCLFLACAMMGRNLIGPAGPGRKVSALLITTIRAS